MALSQTSVIAGGLVVAFIVFVTVNQELPCYLQVLGIGTGAGGNCPSNMGGPNIYGGSGIVSASAGGGGLGIGISPPGININLVGNGLNFGGGTGSTFIGPF